MLDLDPCRFYSPGWLGAALVDRLAGAPPASIIDLGSGAGALAEAAGRRWAAVPVLTVDLDGPPDLGPGRTLTHFSVDALDAYLGEKIGVAPASVDLVLSNPPYRRSDWQPGFATILARAGFSDAIAAPRDVSTALIFVAQAMHLVKPGGTLGLVVPDSMVSGADLWHVREALLSRHAVEKVVQLPRRAFKATDAQTYILVVRKEAKPAPVRLERVALDGSWANAVEITPRDGVPRLDHAFHSARLIGRRPDRTLGALGAQITRGRSSSIEVAGSSGTIFHTCDFPRERGGGVVLNRGRSAGHVDRTGWAQPGDILVARVDRRFEEKVATVVEGTGPISDCVLRLRVPERIRGLVLAGLVSRRGREQLVALGRGTGARHISVASLMSVEV